MSEGVLLSPVKKKIRETSSPARPNKPREVVVAKSPASVITISSDSEEEQDSFPLLDRTPGGVYAATNRGDSGVYSGGE